MDSYGTLGGVPVLPGVIDGREASLANLSLSFRTSFPGVGDPHGMRVISRKRRDRIALGYALSAFAVVVAGVLGAILIAPHPSASLLPIPGLAIYVLCARRAMRLWQGSRGAHRLPQPSRGHTFGAIAVAIIVAGGGRPL